MGRRVVSYFLGATPSFWSGVARLVDLGGVFDAYNVSATPQEADYRALVSDWALVGQDLRDAMADPRQGQLFPD